jgi:universal stress protein E
MDDPVVSRDVVRAGSGRRVLFAITSPYGISRSVLHKAVQLAAALDAELALFYRAYDSEVIHPHRQGPHHHPAEDIRTYVEQRQQQLSAFSEELRATGLSTSAHVAWDSRSDAGILREVSRRRPDFLVIEAFPKTPADGVLSNQTHHKLIEACPCPLLLVRSACPYRSSPRIVAAVDPMHAHAKSSALDDEIVTVASEVADALAGELHLFHARVPWASASHQLRGPQWVPDVAKDESQVDYEHRVKSQVAELAHRYNLADLRTHLVDGDVRDCLPAFSRTEAVDMVAMGVLSRSAFERALLGDTALRLLHALDCDVLIVKPPGYPSA